MSSGGWSETGARGKINLRLVVFPPAADGYHPLETIFCRISLADTVRLRLVNEPGVALGLTGPEPAPAGPDNLAVRAAERLLEAVSARAGVEVGVGVEIELEKRIPAGAGLGGGSSDAAATLRLLNAALDAPLPEPGLLALGAELGSDVPFFLCDAPLALAWGRGDRLLRGPELDARPALLILPDERISTPEAYAALDARREKPTRAGRSPSRMPLALAWRDLADWKRLVTLVHNDFEEVVYEGYPRLRKLKGLILETQPEICLLCGSGSALFAFYESEKEMDVARGQLEGSVENARTVSAIAPV